MEQLSWDMFGLDSGDYYITKAIAYRRDGIRGPAYYDSLAVWAEPRVRRGGESDPVLHIVWATGLAGSGKRGAAVKELSSSSGRQALCMESENTS